MSDGRFHLLMERQGWGKFVTSSLVPGILILTKSGLGQRMMIAIGLMILGLLLNRDCET